jgi:hypothetical protein
MTAADSSFWKDSLPRKKEERIFDRVLASFLSVHVVVNLFNLNQIYDIASWEELRGLLGFTILVAAMVPFLWRGTALGLHVTRFFYVLQIPSTLAIYTFFYGFDCGLNFSAGFLNWNLRFNFMIFHTQFTMGLLNPETDGTAYGLMINWLAVTLAIYYTYRLKKRI